MEIRVLMARRKSSACSLERATVTVLALTFLRQRNGSSGGEVGERHLEAAAHLRIHVVNLARKSVWRKPLAHGVCIKESPIDSFWCSAQDAVKSDGVCCHGKLSFRVIALP